MDEIKKIIDVAAAGGVVATILGWLPAVAATLGIIWYLIQIIESQTGQKFLAWLSRKLFG